MQRSLQRQSTEEAFLFQFHNKLNHCLEVLLRSRNACEYCKSSNLKYGRIILTEIKHVLREIKENLCHCAWSHALHVLTSLTLTPVVPSKPNIPHYNSELQKDIEKLKNILLQKYCSTIEIL